MATRKKNGKSLDGAGSILSTVSGPSTGKPPTSLGSADPTAERLLEKVVGAFELAAQMPFNASNDLYFVV